MKNLSLETCIRLKAAGFDQPAWRGGQLWYFNRLMQSEFTDIVDGDDFSIISSENIYCPTALELAEQIHWCDISFMGNGMYQVQFGEKKTVHQTNNLAETLAEIWLSENYKPQ